MPNFSAHLGMAKDAASRLDHPTLNNNMGAFLLGSVSPDIRIITRGKRDETHFVPLDFEREGDGIEGLFHSHPNLAQASDLNEPTKAFIVGFASHLFTDELWILNLYRPYFGNREVFEDKLLGQPDGPRPSAGAGSQGASGDGRDDGDQAPHGKCREGRRHWLYICGNPC